MSDLVSKAREFALSQHGKQMHGSIAIAEHLLDVAEHVKLYMPDFVGEDSPLFDTYVASAWLHDVVEDTPTNLDEIRHRFGLEVMMIVKQVTDAPGATRFQRHLMTYPKIKDAGAFLVKLCDRRHNHARSMLYGERWMKAYQREYPYFKMALYANSIGLFNELWAELDAQYKAMSALLNREMIE